MKIAFGHHTRDPILTPQEYTFEYFCELLSKCKTGQKNEGYFIRGGDVEVADTYTTNSGTIYKDSYIRADKYLKRAELLVIDADAGADGGNAPPPRAVHEALNKMKLQHAIYTSYSHQPPEKNKYRVVLPCAMEDRAQLKPTIIKLLTELSVFQIHIKHVREMNVWCQRWYMPTRAYAEDGMFEFYKNLDGKPYDAVQVTVTESNERPREVDAKEDIVQQQYTETMEGISYEAAIAAMFQSGEGHTNYTPAALALANKGLSAKDIFDTLRPTCIAAFAAHGRKWDTFRDTNLRDAVTSAIRKVEQERMQQEPVEIGRVEEIDEYTRAVMLPNNILAPVDTAIGELTLALYKTWWIPNMMVAALAARSIVAYFGGGKYRSELGDRMNIQQLAIGETGCGKDLLLEAPRRVINMIIGNGVPQGSDAELFHGVIDEVGSAQGIDRRLRTNGSKHDILIVQDEFGGMMQGRLQNEHKRGVLELLLKFYTKADSTFAERLLANSQLPKEAAEILYAPHVILSSATTPALMMRSIDNTFISHGNASRMLFFNADPYTTTIQERCQELVLSADLIARLRQIADQTEITSRIMQLPQARVFSPMVVTMDEGARKIAYDASVYNQKRNHVYKDVWNRQVPNAKKYAMIEAILENPARPVITQEIMKRSLILVANACTYTENLYHDNIGENEQDVARKKVLQILKKADGKWISKRDIFQTTKLRALKSYERTQLLKELVDIGEIDEGMHPNSRGRPTTLYRYNFHR